LEGIRQSWKDQEDWRKSGRVGGMIKQSLWIQAKLERVRKSWRESRQRGRESGRV
jgi:hypothetical protein